MKSFRISLQAALAASLLSVAHLALAQSAYTTVSVPFVPSAMSQGGRVAGPYDLTGLNGAGDTSLGSYGSGSDYGLSDYGISSWSGPFSSGANFQAPITAPFISSATYANPSVTVVGVNDAGQVVANAYFQGSDDAPYEGNVGEVVNVATGNLTVLGQSTSVSGINSSGVVSFINDQNTQIYSGTAGTSSYTLTTTGGAIQLYNSGTGAVSTVSDLGYGGIAANFNYGAGQTTATPSAAINSTGQVTGGLYTSDLSTEVYNPNTWSFQYTSMSNGGNGYTRAFRTGANGAGTQVFGTANGVSSMGTVINDSGELGGYITLASGSREAFLTTAHGGMLVGLGAGAASDSTQVDFLNNNGQAIVYDSTTEDYYLYSAGYVVPVSSLTGQASTGSYGTCSTNCVVGFNDAGQILLDGNSLLTPTSSNWGSATAMATYTGATSITGTSAFTSVSQSQGGATPDSTFYSNPSASTDSVALQQVGGAAGVPEPGTLLLLALAAFAVVKGRGLTAKEGAAA